MQRQLLKSKIHRAVVTEANLHYTGSLTLGRPLAQAADILAHEFVHITNVNNGRHWVTYVIIDCDHDNTVCLNGSAARHFIPGDPIIIMAYGYYGQDELDLARPRLVYVNQNNEITQIVTSEPPFESWESPASPGPGLGTVAK